MRCKENNFNLNFASVTKTSRDFNKFLQLLILKWLQSSNQGKKHTFWRGIDEALLPRWRLFFPPSRLKVFGCKGERNQKTLSLKCPEMPMGRNHLNNTMNGGTNTTSHNSFKPFFNTVSFRLRKQSSITFSLFFINNFMKSLLKIKFLKKRLGEVMRDAYEMMVIPVDVYLLDVNSRDTRARCEIYSKLTIQISERFLQCLYC